MPGSKKLRSLRLGLETTAGNAVATTTLWRGVGTLEDQRVKVAPEEDVGYLSGVDRQYEPKLLGALSMEPTPATFQQLPYLGAAGVKDVVTGSADGSGSGKVYTYTFPTAAKNTFKTYTVEGGDDQAVEEMEYAFVESFKLSGKGGEALMMSAEWKGRQVVVSSWTTTATLPTVETINFSKGVLYIDDVDGTLGDTPKSNTLLGMDLDVKTGLVAVFTADGELYFSFAKSTGPELTLVLTFEHDGTATAEKVNWRAGTARQIRLKWVGSALETSGTAYSYHTLILDVAGKWAKFDKLAEQDGNDIVTGTFDVKYNSTAELFAEMTVVNELASLP